MSECMVRERIFHPRWCATGNGNTQQQTHSMCLWAHAHSHMVHAHEHKYSCTGHLSHHVYTFPGVLTKHTLPACAIFLSPSFIFQFILHMLLIFSHQIFPPFTFFFFSLLSPQGWDTHFHPPSQPPPPTAESRLLACELRWSLASSEASPPFFFAFLFFLFFFLLCFQIPYIKRGLIAVVW